MSGRTLPLRAATVLLGVCGLGMPVGLAAHAPQQDVLVGRVEIREAPSAWLGVKFQKVVAHDSVHVIVASVFPGSPADRAGLRSGDRLLRVNGAGATTRLMESLAPRMKVGDPFTFTVLRGGSLIEASLVAEPRPESEDIMVTRMQTQLDTLRKLIGLSLDSLERSGLAGLPSLEVRRIDGADGSVTIVVSTGEGAVTLPESMLAAVEPAWSDAEHFAAAWTVSDSTRLRTPFPVTRGEIAKLPAEPGRIEVRIRTDDEQRARAREVQGWSISSPLSPYQEGANRVAGAELHPVGAGLGRYLGIDHGLMVAEVTPGTPASIAGLRPGDVLVSVDGVAVDTVREFRDVMSVPSRARSLVVVRQGVEMELTLRR